MLDHKTSPFSFSLTSCLTFSTFLASSLNAEPVLFLSQSELGLLHRYRYWGNSLRREKGFSAGRPSKETGGKAQISLPIRGFLTHFWVRWGVCYEDVLVGRFWKAALCGQVWEWGFSTRSSWTAALPGLWFGARPVLWFYEGTNFCTRSCLRSTLSPLCMLWLHDLEFCSVVSEDQLSTLLKTG